MEKADRKLYPPSVAMHLRFHEQSCNTCRYMRRRRGERTTDCLLLGRTLSIGGNAAYERERVCDGWRRRPKTWDIFADKSPFWHDKYISRESQKRIRKRLGLREEKP